MKTALAVVLLLALGLSALAQQARPKHEWEPAEPLVGPVSLDEFATRLPAWETRARAWKPAEDVVQMIRDARPARVEIVFGAWCGDSYDHLPPLVAALRAAANPGLEIVLTAIDRAKQDPTGAAARLGVTKVPTIVVFHGAVEVGRVIETPSTTMDRDVGRLLNSYVGDAPVDRREVRPRIDRDETPQPPGEK